MQIANARLMRLPGHRESLSATHIVRQAVANYPFRSKRERDCVTISVEKDFFFLGSGALFHQVLDNLMKNALRSLAATSAPCEPGDIRFEIGELPDGRGRITLVDRGVGIAAELQPRIFEPFFSTSDGTGHGLGLAFCRRVVESAGGSIRVRSEAGKGAAFTIELPAR